METVAKNAETPQTRTRLLRFSIYGSEQLTTVSRHGPFIAIYTKTGLWSTILYAFFLKGTLMK